MKLHLLLILSILLLSACQNEPRKTTSGPAEYEVKYYGALKNMMHLGDISAKYNLKDLKGKKHLYALGAMENLKGEIQIFNGASFNTLVQSDSVIFDKTFDKKANLLVFAEVDKWQVYLVPNNISTYKEFENHLEKTAKSHGIDTDKPFPFLLNGTPTSFDWHVINWPEGDTIHSHEKHVSSGEHGTIHNREIEMLGFYSKSHHAIFTHHTTNMHIHFKTRDDKLAGHIDGLKLGKDMILKIPATK